MNVGDQSANMLHSRLCFSGVMIAKRTGTNNACDETMTSAIAAVLSECEIVRETTPTHAHTHARSVGGAEPSK